MLEAVEKGRKNLSGDDEARVEVDFLLDDEDLEVEITREEFENLI